MQLYPSGSQQSLWMLALTGVFAYRKFHQYLHCKKEKKSALGYYYYIYSLQHVHVILQGQWGEKDTRSKKCNGRFCIAEIGLKVHSSEGKCGKIVSQNYTIHVVLVGWGKKRIPNPQTFCWFSNFVGHILTKNRSKL